MHRIQPKETKTETVGRRTVVWYSHATDPAWQAKRADDRNSVYEPKDDFYESANPGFDPYEYVYW